MTQDMELKLQAYLDGELPPGEAKTVAALIANDGQARELLTELKHTRAVLTAHEVELKVPASREFYWSGIRRGIERLEVTPRPQAESVSILAVLRRLLIPASGLIAVLLVVMLTLNPFRPTTGRGGEEAETSFTDAGAFTYHDYSSGTTLVWVDYPAEKDLADQNTDDSLDFD